jgi:hypothetical protein
MIGRTAAEYTCLAQTSGGISRTAGMALGREEVCQPRREVGCSGGAHCKVRRRQASFGGHSYAYGLVM